jgi:hypothetical protein
VYVDQDLLIYKEDVEIVMMIKFMIVIILHVFVDVQIINNGSMENVHVLKDIINLETNVFIAIRMKNLIKIR